LIFPQLFYNGLWRCEDILDVLNQFDFTANAIALDLFSSKILDPQNGIRDLSRNELRAVRFDYPDEPISPGTKLTRNAVMWYRFQHFAFTKRLSIEPVTLSWVRQNRRYIEARSEFERVFYPIDDRSLVTGY
jgi:hypothetical protein